MKPARTALLLGTLLVPACASSGALPPMTQLQLREYQTRTFDVADTRVVLKALVNVLMDDGYIVQVANTELGVVSASRQVGVENKMHVLLARLTRDPDLRWDRTQIIEVTANVGSYAGQTRVRASFQVKKVDNVGAVSKIHPYGDESLYRDFFTRIDKSIFIEKEKL